MSVEKVTNGKDVVFPGNTPRESAQKVTKNERFQFPPIHDINDISEDLRHYFEEGINIRKSSAEVKNGEISFNIFFNSRSKENMTLNGSYSFNSNKLNAQIGFSFQKEVDENGILRNKQFEFTYNLEAENIFEKKKSVKEEKEDILSFVRRISHKVYELAEDDSLKLRSVFFDEEDLKDIIYFQDDKGRQILMELVNLVILTARLKESENKNKNAVETDYFPERKKTEKEETESLKINKFNAVIDVKESETEKEEDNGASEQ
ncbi:MAG: hypothetical protein ACEPO8_03940 [Rhodothermaceae bacterium]